MPVPEKPVPSPGQKLKGLFWAFLLGGGLCALVLEAGLRVVPTPGVSFFQWRFDSRLGLVLAQTRSAVHGGSCFLTKNMQFNRFGFRDREHAIKKTGPRILVTGDSFLEAFTVTDREAFGARLEALTGIETVRLARRGYGTANALAIYALLGKKFRPDLVIHGVYLGNDLMDDWGPLQRLTATGGNLSSPWAEPKDERLVLHPPRPQTVSPVKKGFSPQRVSYLFRFLRAVQGQGMAAVFKSDTGAAGQRRFPEAYNTFRPPKGEWRKAWAHQEALLRAYRNEVSQNGGRLVVMTVPGFAEQSPTAAMLRGSLAKAYGATVPGDVDPRQAERRLLVMIGRLNIAAINLYPVMRNAPKDWRRLGYPRYGLPCDSHWNREGHEKAAAAAAAWVKQHLPLPRQ